jgi:hypothetical protein
MTKQIKYQKPNFEQRWSRAESFPEFQDMGKTNWKNFAGTGCKVHLSKIMDNINGLEPEDIDVLKKAKVKDQIAAGIVEMPILVKLAENKYEVVCGKTRISELLKSNQDPLVWVIDISEMMFLIRPVC